MVKLVALLAVLAVLLPVKSWYVGGGHKSAHNCKPRGCYAVYPGGPVVCDDGCTG